MADYPVIDPRAFGHTNSIPNAVGRLPVNLLRTALVTRQPETSAAAMANYRAGMEQGEFSPPMNLPQRMMFQQHKMSQNGGISRPNDRAALSSALSLSAALAPTTVSSTTPALRGLSAVTTVSLRTPEQVPTYNEARAAAARGAQAFPQPEVGLPPEGILLRTRPLRQPIAPPMQAYGDALAESQQLRAAEAAFRTSNAMRSVATTQANIRRILGF